MLTFNQSQTFATTARIDASHGLDSYAANGVLVSRDAASMIHAALKRDAYEMRERGGDANNAQADLNIALADSIIRAQMTDR